MRLLLFAALFAAAFVPVGSCRYGFELDDLAGAEDAGADNAGTLADGRVDVPEALDASTPDASASQVDAGPTVCPAPTLPCPGNQPVRTLTCGALTDCWVGCRDGPLSSPNQAAAWCQSWGRVQSLLDDPSPDIQRVAIRHLLTWNAKPREFLARLELAVLRNGPAGTISAGSQMGSVARSRT